MFINYTFFYKNTRIFHVVRALRGDAHAGPAAEPGGEPAGVRPARDAGSHARPEPTVLPDRSYLKPHCPLSTLLPACLAD